MESLSTAHDNSVPCVSEYSSTSIRACGSVFPSVLGGVIRELCAHRRGGSCDVKAISLSTAVSRRPRLAGVNVQSRRLGLDHACDIIHVKLDRLCLELVQDHGNDLPAEFLTQKERQLRDILRVECRVGKDNGQMSVGGQEDRAE